MNPKDISHVSVGQEALVRLSALNQRITPTVGGSVIYVSADAVAAQMQAKNEARPDNDTRREFYVVRVRLDRDDILRRMPEFHPTPGMPADVYIRPESVFFEYIMRPVFDSFSRGFRKPEWMSNLPSTAPPNTRNWANRCQVQRSERS